MEVSKIKVNEVIKLKLKKFYVTTLAEKKLILYITN